VSKIARWSADFEAYRGRRFSPGRFERIGYTKAFEIYTTQTCPAKHPGQLPAAIAPWNARSFPHGDAPMSQTWLITGNVERPNTRPVRFMRFLLLSSGAFRSVLATSLLPTLQRAQAREAIAERL